RVGALSGEFDLYEAAKPRDGVYRNLVVIVCPLPPQLLHFDQGLDAEGAEYLPHLAYVFDARLNLVAVQAPSLRVEMVVLVVYAELPVLVPQPEPLSHGERGDVVLVRGGEILVCLPHFALVLAFPFHEGNKGPDVLDLRLYLDLN